jgi:hypothetical protein
VVSTARDQSVSAFRPTSLLALEDAVEVARRSGDARRPTCRGSAPWSVVPVGAPTEGGRTGTSIQNDSGLPQRHVGASGAS